jgi:Bacterial Ig domain
MASADHHGGISPAATSLLTDIGRPRDGSPVAVDAMSVIDDCGAATFTLVAEGTGSLKCSGLVVGLAAVVSVFVLCDAHAAECIHRVRFHFTSQGPWGGSIGTAAGTPCTGNFRSGGNTVFKRLNLLGAPQHGSISLRPGGYFTYTPAAGFRGSDSFQLQVCGKEGTIEGCADLNYAATVN